MLSNAFNIAKARRWQETRRRIRTASDPARLRLLQSFGEEVRATAIAFSRAAAQEKRDIADSLEPDSAFCVLIGAWLNLDPTNSGWIGRDRLYATRLDDIVNACAVLSACGFFPAESLPELVKNADAGGRDAVIPGIESPGVPAEEIPQLAWESATASARDKRRWREAFAEGSRGDWLSEAWRAAPETWRTCVVLDAAEPVAAACRALAGRKGEAAAGLAALVKTQDAISHSVVGEWVDAGWKTVEVSVRDIARLHDVLAGTTLDRPLAVVLAAPAKAAPRRRSSALLGRLPDDQFSALFDESLRPS